MVVLFTCKNEEDPIKKESARMVTTLNIDVQTLNSSYLRSQCWGWPKFKIIQTLMVVLVTCKNKKDPFKTDGARVVIT